MQTKDMFIRSVYECGVRGNHYIDFAGYISTDDVLEMVELMQEFHMEKFTISSTCTAIIKVIADFIKAGCTLEGMTEIYGIESDWNNDQRNYKQAPAFLLSLPEKEEDVDDE